VKRSLETGPEERHKVELKEVKKGAFTEKASRGSTWNEWKRATSCPEEKKNSSRRTECFLFGSQYHKSLSVQSTSPGGARTTGIVARRTSK
jgi:hypothetical protein